MFARVLQWPKTIALVLGALSALGFAPLSLKPLTFAAIALLMVLVRTAPDRKAALARGYWFGTGHFVVGLNWIAGSFRYQDAMPVWLGWVAVVAVAIYLAIYPAVASGIAWRYGRRSGVAFAFWFAGAWIVTEWLRATLFTGFAWNPLSVVAVQPYIMPHGLKLFGAYGASGLFVLTSGIIAWGILAMKAASSRDRVALFAKMCFAVMGANAIFAVLDWASDTQAAPSPTRTIRIVQPNIGQQDKYDETFDATNFARLAEQTGRPGSTPRLILWPEAAIPDNIGETWESSARSRDRLATLLGPNDVLLTGADKIFEEKRAKGIATEREWIGAANSVFALNAQGKILWRYDKAHLVPYGEYLPLRPFMSAIGLSRLVPGDLDFWPGPGPRSHDVPGFGKVGLQVCYEIIFSGQVVDRANRPDFIFNPSNDAWFGSWGSPQFVAQSQLRAVEEGLPVVRSTPTGISAVIDSNGRIVQSLPYQKAGAIETHIPVAHKPTPFARYGNILSLALAFFLMVAGVALGRRSG
jgi:apolipoprotein N-acyltransferase